MKKKRYAEEQIAFALSQHESGTAVSEIVFRDRPEVGNFRVDVLPLEEEVCRAWCCRAAASEITRRREFKTEAAGADRSLRDHRLPQ
tara:strand:- start:21231 stop:21491 length:261 start_codon:yes stop_codon:yes gene_type:complete